MQHREWPYDRIVTSEEDIIDITDKRVNREMQNDNIWENENIPGKWQEAGMKGKENGSYQKYLTDEENQIQWAMKKEQFWYDDIEMDYMKIMSLEQSNMAVPSLNC